MLSLGVIDIVGSDDEPNGFAQHGTTSECASVFATLGWDWSDYSVHNFVRNPWDRYLSFYTYYLGIHNTPKAALDAMSGPERRQYDISCRLVGENTPTEVLRRMITNQHTQWEYLGATDYVYVFEDMQNEFDRFLGNVGITDCSLGHSNKSTSTLPKGDVYTQELVDLVAAKECRVIEEFGYTYDPG